MSAINILVVHRIKERHIELLKSTMENVNVTVCQYGQIGQYIADTDILIIWGSMDISEYLPQASRLRWIHALSSGVENLLSPAIRDSSIILTNSKGIHGIPIAEHTLAVILNFTRGLELARQLQNRHEWNRLSLDEIYDKTIAIAGLGSIGREIAKRAKALGMRVLATKRTVTTELFADKLYPPEQLYEMLSIADFAVATLPLTDQTVGLFNETAFASMKRTAYFINVARGAIVDEPSLINALQQGVIKGAALDVFEQEPLPPDSPLWNAPNLLITPHIAANSPYYTDRSLKIFIQNMAKFTDKADMINVVDKQKGY